MRGVWEEEYPESLPAFTITEDTGLSLNTPTAYVNLTDEQQKIFTDVIESEKSEQIKQGRRFNIKSVNRIRQNSYII